MISTRFYSLSVRIFRFSLFILAVSSLKAADPNEFLEYNYDVGSDGSVETPGRLFVPDSYDGSAAFPLVLFFHGFGEGGENNTSQVNGNIDNLLSNAKSWGFFIYAPQNNYQVSWNPTSVTDAMRMVASLLEDYNIDPSRIYVTGLSNGGQGAYTAASLYDGIIAASTVINGSPGPGVFYDRLVGDPIWIYHARNDSSTSVGTSRNMTRDIRAADGNKPALQFPLDDDVNYEYYSDGSPYYTDGSTFYEENGLRYSEYPTGGHGIWSRAYNESPMYDWLLNHTINPDPLQEGETILLDFGSREFLQEADSSGRWWNSTKGWLEKTLEVTFPFATTDTGRRTKVMVRLLDAFGSRNHNEGIYTGGLFDEAIARDSWLSSRDATESNAGALLFSGLAPGASYTLTFFASYNNDDQGRGRMSRYKVDDQFVDLEAANNANNVAALENVVADENGRFVLKVFPTPNSGSRYGQLNAMTLQREVNSGPANYTEWANGFSTAPSEDENADGIQNILAYALGAEPDEHAHERLPTLTKSNANDDMQLNLPALSRPDITYRILSNETLDPEQWTLLAEKSAGAPSFTIETGISIQTDTEADSIKIVDTRPLTPRRFYVLEVEAQ
ncbi:hypothetical protein [Cerasicoccus arenae]|uniref:Uncharacterized protein n=1 Tax=Cerasicoccus arenae TaxID=424488 RepID=A0A8J3DI01_9BACT|nr:hypothetical protein [Cerasicoccus arenae]MBK1859235.1 hypothetical protein [Cerasicoccus arenae]GHC02764.1 hypothetical protein GCM10007047_19300 [Cerasicoccus arenae]